MLRQLWQRCIREPGNAPAWNELLARVHPVFIRIANRVGWSRGIRRPEEIDDLVQDICLKVSQVPLSSVAMLPDDDASVEAYLKVTAANAARDSLRIRFAGKRGVQATVTLEDHVDGLADDLGCRGMDRQILFRQVDELLDASTRERAIFWLYYHQGLTSKEIAAIPAVNLTSKGVESLLHRLTIALRVRVGPAERNYTSPVDRTDPASEGGN